MFKKEFQGGAYFEVFSAQGKDPTAQWKLTGSASIRKEFDRNVKSFVYVLDGAVATTKMQLPKDSKQTLALTQRYLVMQIIVPKGQDVSIDLGVQDLNHCKRRLFFSTAHKETQTTPLHNKIPLSFIKKDTWLNLVIDMKMFVSDTWRGQMYNSLESICLSANCRLRRIFTMRSQPPDTTDDEELYGTSDTNNGDFESIPKQCQLAPDIPQVTQVINVVKVQRFEGKFKPPECVTATKPPTGSSSEDLNSSGNRKSVNSDAYHIAFGTKVSGQRKIKDKEISSKIKAQHNRSRSELDNVQQSTRVDSTQRIRSAESKTNPPKRERKNSDPGATNADSDLSVDKASLRTSRTWTDGADNGKENIPFVRPHPPSGLSSERARRKPRVKSAGKERTPHTGFSKDERIVKSQPSSRHNSISNIANKKEEEPTPQPKVVANDCEVDDIMAAMKESVRKSWSNNSGSESDLETQGDDDSISEVISVLRGTTLSDGRTTAAPKEYEDSDSEENDIEEIEDKVYMFSSPPKSAPRHMTNNYVGSSISGTPSEKNQAKHNKAKSNKDTRKKGLELDQTPGSHLTSSQRDFWRDPGASSDEEESLRSKLDKHSINLRAGSHTKDGGRDASSGAESDEHTKYPYPHVVGATNGLLHVPTGYDGPLPGGTGRNRGGMVGVNLPRVGAGHTPINSQTRQSISKKSLREIPPDDVRLSQTPKPYNSAKYQMEDLSESFEAKMLQELKLQALQGSIEDSEDEKPRPTPRTLAAQREKHKRDKDLVTYNDSCSESDEDHTPFSTFRSQNYATKAHNYQDEMKMASARLNQNDFLSQSNPRDWGKIYSPPIILTNDTNESPSSMSQVSPTDQQVSPGSHIPQFSPSQKELISPQENTDDEEELDLLFDPVLNCYFDPKTQKYYELKF